MLSLLVGLAFGAHPLDRPPGVDGLGAGVVDGVGGAVVLSAQPDDRVAVVLPRGCDGDAGAEGQRDLAVAHRLLPERVVGVGGDAEGGSSRSNACSARSVVRWAAVARSRRVCRLTLAAVGQFSSSSWFHTGSRE